MIYTLSVEEKKAFHEDGFLIVPQLINQEDIQELYINALARETQMTKRTIQKLLDRRVNVYLTAEEAVEYGIADEIIN